MLSKLAIVLLGLTSVSAGGSGEISSLTQLRGILSSYESSIVHTALARAVFNTTASISDEEKWQVQQYLKVAATVDSESQFTSVESKVPDPAFSGQAGCTLPFIDFARNSTVGATYGDPAAQWEPSVFDYTFDSLYPATINGSADSLPAASPPTGAISGPSFALLSTISGRISTGRDVALAKLYGATAAPANSSTPPNSTVCGYLKNNDVENVRNFLTDLKQVQSVRNSVTGKVTNWVNGSSTDGSVNAAEWVPKIVGLFNIIINVTTDVEVATLLQLQASGETGC